MNQQNGERAALDAYLHLLAAKGAGAEALAQREAVLLRLIALLQELPAGEGQYRSAVEKMMLQSEKASWPAFLSVVREYYYFWTDDIKAIASMHARGDLDVAPLATALQDESLRTQWDNLESEVFSVSEKWTLKAYAAALRDEGANKTVIGTRDRLVKLLLLRLREAASKDGRNYRIAVNATLPLFDLRETRMLFLIVVREFFYFWIGDPEAARYIVLDERESPESASRG